MDKRAITKQYKDIGEQLKKIQIVLNVDIANRYEVKVEL